MGKSKEEHLLASLGLCCPWAAATLAFSLVTGTPRLSSLGTKAESWL